MCKVRQGEPGRVSSVNDYTEYLLRVRATVVLVLVSFSANEVDVSLMLLSQPVLFFAVLCVMLRFPVCTTSVTFGERNPLTNPDPLQLRILFIVTPDPIEPGVRGYLFVLRHAILLQAEQCVLVTVLGAVLGSCA